jgi:hypothetical protein
MLHWREAARFALVPWYTFRRLEADEQAAIIAHYETINRIEALESDYLARKRGK